MNSIEKFKNIIRFIVSIFASREFAFVYCIVGTLAQTAHTYYLVVSISSLTSWAKILQGIGLSLFISSSLLFFTAIAPAQVNSKSDKNIIFAVNLFMIIEIIINFYYYASHLLIQPKLASNTFSTINIFDFVFAVLVSCLIPVTIKLYAGIIQAKEWLDMVVYKKNDIFKEFSENIKPINTEKTNISSPEKKKPKIIEV